MLIYIKDKSIRVKKKLRLYSDFSNVKVTNKNNDDESKVCF